MYEEQTFCPICNGVVQDGACTMCGQKIEKPSGESEDDEFTCPNCKRPESQCICGE